MLSGGWQPLSPSRVKSQGFGCHSSFIPTLWPPQARSPPTPWLWGPCPAGQHDPPPGAAGAGPAGRAMLTQPRHAKPICQDAARQLAFAGIIAHLHAAGFGESIRSSPGRPGREGQRRHPAQPGIADGARSRAGAACCSPCTRGEFGPSEGPSENTPMWQQSCPLEPRIPPTPGP